MALHLPSTRSKLFEGLCTIAVINFRLALNKSVEFSFRVSRSGVKVLFEATPVRPKQRQLYQFINPNKPLQVTVSEKLAYKYLTQHDNSFGNLIASRLQLVNDKLQFKAVQEYSVREVHH